MDESTFGPLRQGIEFIASLSAEQAGTLVRGLNERGANDDEDRLTEAAKAARIDGQEFISRWSSLAAWGMQIIEDGSAEDTKGALLVAGIPEEHIGKALKFLGEVEQPIKRLKGAVDEERGGGVAFPMLKNIKVKVAALPIFDKDSTKVSELESYRPSVVGWNHYAVLRISFFQGDEEKRVDVRITKRQLVYMQGLLTFAEKQLCALDRSSKGDAT